MQKFKVNGQSVPKISENKRTDVGDCITSHANAVGNQHVNIFILMPYNVLLNQETNKMIIILEFGQNTFLACIAACYLCTSDNAQNRHDKVLGRVPACLVFFSFRALPLGSVSACRLLALAGGRPSCTISVEAQSASATRVLNSCSDRF